MLIDIEDLDNWHGKPIPKDRVDDLLNDLQAQIQVPNKTLCPELPKDDAAPADLRPISLPSPPAYKKGDKVLLGTVGMCRNWTQPNDFLIDIRINKIISQLPPPQTLDVGNLRLLFLIVMKYSFSRKNMTMQWLVIHCPTTY